MIVLCSLSAVSASGIDDDFTDSITDSVSVDGLSVADDSSVEYDEGLSVDDSLSSYDNKENNSIGFSEDDNIIGDKRSFNIIVEQEEYVITDYLKIGLSLEGDIDDSVFLSEFTVFVDGEVDDYQSLMWGGEFLVLPEYVPRDFTFGYHDIIIQFDGNDEYESTSASCRILKKLSISASVDNDDGLITVKSESSSTNGNFTVYLNEIEIGTGVISDGSGTMAFDKIVDPGYYNFDILYYLDGDESIFNSKTSCSFSIPREDDLTLNNNSQWSSTGFDNKNSGHSNYTRLSNVVVYWMYNNAINFTSHSFSDDYGGFTTSASAVIDSEGNIYISDDAGLYVFNNEGTLKYKSMSVNRNGGVTLYGDQIILSSCSINYIRLMDSLTLESFAGYLGFSTASRFPAIVGADGRVYIVATWQDNANKWITALKYDGDKFDLDTSYYKDTSVGSLEGPAPITSMPVFSEDNILWIPTYNGLHAIDVSTGSDVFENNIGVSGRPVVDSANIVYYLGTNNVLYALTEAGYLWNTSVAGGVGTTLASSDEYVYSVNKEGSLYKYNRENGVEELVGNLGSSGQSIIVDGDNNVYVSTVGGDVIAYDSENNKLWAINLGSDIIGQLAMDKNGVIYVYTTDTIYALGYKNETVLNASAGEILTVFDDITVTATIDENATGYIYFTVNDGEATPIAIENGRAVLPLSELSLGNYIVVISYEGDEHYAPATSSVNFTIVKADPNMNFNVNATPDLTTVNVTLLGNATGRVFVVIGDKGYFGAVADGEVVFEIQGLEAGEIYLGNINYEGDENYNGALSTLYISVPEKELKDANLTVTSENNIVNVTLDSDATGYVIIRIDGSEYYAVVDGNVISVEIKGLNPGGIATANIIYSGDENYKNATASTLIYVPGRIFTTMSVTAQNNTVNVALPEDVTGYVTVEVDGTSYYAEVVNGSASITLQGLSGGNYTANVFYSGDDNYLPANGETTISIPKYEKTTPTMTVTATNTTVDVVLPGDATGYILADINGVGYYSVVSNGKASIAIPNLAAGNYTVPVIYTGDDNYKKANTNTVITVEESYSVVITAPSVVKYYGDSQRFRINVTDNKGNVLANKNVTVVINGVSTNKVTNENGTCTAPLNLFSGNYTVQVICENTTITSSVEIKSTVSGSDITKIYRNGTQYEAYFKDKNGNALANTQISFNINGAVYDRTTNAYGRARLNINLIPGNYTITAINNVTGESASNKITVESPITENKDIVKKYRNGTQFQARILDGTGSPVAKGVAVSFNINGMQYTRYTNDNGYVKLNINLMAGEYIITTTYNGVSASNKITVID